MQTVEDEVFLCSRLLARLEKAEEAKGKGDSRSSAGNAEMKSYLKSALKIPTFHGDVMKWSEFWELFTISVHDNPSFADVQKFVVLKSHPAGVALRAIQGIPVSGEGYAEAVAALRKRFKLDDVRRETLMREMLNMPSVRSNDLKAMRSLIDHLTAHSRALGTLGVPSESFSCLLLPIVKDKIPEDWRIEWARRESSNFPDFLDFLQQEVRIRESARGGAAATEAPLKPVQTAPPVSSSLNARQVPRLETRPQSKPRLHPCGACGKVGHDLSRCEKLQRMPIDARWDVVRASKACFRCLRVGHRSNECKAGACSMCGRHHHSLLHNSSSSPTGEAAGLSAHAAPFSPAQVSTPAAKAATESRDAQSSRHRYNVSGQRGNECFFQTALVEAEGPRGRRMTRILLDGGSGSSYIRSSLAEELGLPVTDSGTFSCIGFQEKAEEPRQYDRVRVGLRSRFGEGPVSLDLWSTDRVCCPLPTPTAPPLPSEMPELMADDFGGGEVDILIGIDNLYHVVLWEQVDLGEGLRAIDTVFGYVMHGRQGGGSSGQPCRMTNHIRQIEQMWDLDTIGINGNDDSEETYRDESPPTWNEDEERYEMGLVWRSAERPVSNMNAARMRTRRMTEKLGDERAQMYHDQVLNMLETSVIEVAPVPAADHCSDERKGELRRDHVPAPEVESNEESEVTMSVEVGSKADCGIDPEFGHDPTPTHSRVSSSKERPTRVLEKNETENSRSVVPEATGGSVADGRPSDAFFLPHRGVFQKEKLRIFSMAQPKMAWVRVSTTTCIPVRTCSRSYRLWCSASEPEPSGVKVTWKPRSTRCQSTERIEDICSSSGPIFIWGSQESRLGCPALRICFWKRLKLMWADTRRRTLSCVTKSVQGSTWTTSAPHSVHVRRQNWEWRGWRKSSGMRTCSCTSLVLPETLRPMAGF